MKQKVLSCQILFGDILIYMNLEKQIFDEKYLKKLSNRTHLVILGAGASLASFPNGDKNGKKVPLMNELINLLDLDKILGTEFAGKNIEEIFSELYTDVNYVEKLKLVEEKIFEYFDCFELPDEPTIYDHLILSLREKDVIASFNWDPFLFKAAQRNYNIAKSPTIVFLHGNVSIGYCLNCPKFGNKGDVCVICNEKYKDSELLYPIGEKDYDKSILIKSAWGVLKLSLKNSLILTIFGYSAPESDRKAMDIFEENWGPSSKREVEQIEIIHRPNITDNEKDLLKIKWDELIHSHHYDLFGSIYSSQIMKYPRRSCEAFWSGYMNCEPYTEYEIPKFETLQKLQEWYKPIVASEDK